MQPVVHAVQPQWSAEGVVMLVLRTSCADDPHEAGSCEVDKALQAFDASEGCKGSSADTCCVCSTATSAALPRHGA